MGPSRSKAGGTARPARPGRREPGQRPIFCNCKRDVGIVYRSLQRHGYDAAELHGDMAQPARMETLDRFRRARCVCWSVPMSRCAAWISRNESRFQPMPSNAEDYVHRIGRPAAPDAAARPSHWSPVWTSSSSAIEKLIGGKIRELMRLDEAEGRRCRRTPAPPRSAPALPPKSAARAGPDAAVADKDDKTTRPKQA